MATAAVVGDTLEVMYLVVATHNILARRVSNPILITRNAIQAVQTARKAHNLGYHFLVSEVGINVYKLTINSEYSAADFSWNESGNDPRRIMVFSRTRVRHPNTFPWQMDWLERWFDRAFQRAATRRPNNQ